MKQDDYKILRKKENDVTLSVSSSKCSAESMDLAEPGTTDMYFKDTFWEKDTNFQKNQEKHLKYQKMILSTIREHCLQQNHLFWKYITRVLYISLKLKIGEYQLEINMRKYTKT